jgi:glucosyl-dolichyl phosphate glucuronosyltransferase
MIKNPAISVVVCTHNRAALLDQALESLVSQTLDRSQFEIIVVNNCSSDDTAGVVERYKAHRAGEVLLRSVDEPVLGLGHARNTGWQAAQGDYVAFMDDDAKADPHWLERALDLLRQHAAMPVAVGGQIRPLYVSPKPAWYKDEYEVRSWGEVSRRLVSGESFSGSNMIVSKAILRRLNGFDASVGMRGERVSMGEETVLFNKIWHALGDQTLLMYSPDLVVYHAVGKHNMRPRYHLRRWFVAGQVACRLEAPSGVRNRISRLRATVTTIRTLIRAAVSERKYFPDYRTWMVERLGPVALEIGRLLACIGLHIPVRRANPSAEITGAGKHGGGHSVEAVRWFTS